MSNFISKSTLRMIDNYLKNDENNKDIYNKEEILVSDLNFEKYFSFKKFNKIQSIFLKKTMNGIDDFLISSPTSSGKTVLFELSIIKYYSNILKVQNNKKTIYISPLRALCYEQFYNWSQKFKFLNLNIVQCVGDSTTDDLDILNAHIIITTYEKLDYLLKKWKNYLTIFNNLGLFLIDEIHFVADYDRGASAESVINRINYFKKITKNEEISTLKIIAVSASIPNYKDFGNWLNIKENNMLVFNESFREVPLEYIVRKYRNNSNPYMFDNSLNIRLLEIFELYNNSFKPTIIFCPTQKSTINTCKFLYDNINFNNEKLVNHKINEISDKKLKNFVYQGIAYHNGSLNTEDRIIIEYLFKQKYIKVICATTTLSLGINLPAYCVIIKGTSCYKSYNKGYSEYSKIEIQQMSGRAGRMGLEKEGKVIILTNTNNNIDYLNMDNNIPIISQYENIIADNLLNEICLKNIKNIEQAEIFLNGTFYMTLEKKNNNNDSLKLLKDITLKNIYLLINAGIITINDDNYFKVNNIGNCINKNNIYVKSYDIIKDFCYKEFSLLIEVISTCYEFEGFLSKVNERKSLNYLNANIKYPIKGSINTASKKVNVLIQSYIIDLNIDNWELKKNIQEITIIFKNILNVLKVLHYDHKNGTEYIMALKLLKYIKHKSKFKDNNIISIISQIKELNIKTLNKEIDTSSIKLSKIQNMSENEINVIFMKESNDNFGYFLKGNINCYTKLIINIKNINYSNYSGSLVITGVSCEHQNHNKYMLVNIEDNKITFNKNISYENKPVTINFNFKKLPVIIHLINYNIYGKDIELVIQGSDLNNSNNLINHKKLKVNKTIKKSKYGVNNISEKSKTVRKSKSIINNLLDTNKFKFLNNFFNK